MIEQSIRNEILQLKKEKDVAILAHYYVDGEVQEIADLCWRFILSCGKSNKDNTRKYIVLWRYFYG